MASDQTNMAAFDRSANDPELWRLRGLDLHTAAHVLREKAVQAMKGVHWSDLKLDDPAVGDCFTYAGLVFQAAMLQGFAVECLLKCFYISKGNAVAADGEYKIEAIKRENHDLVQIASAVGYVLSGDEPRALGVLSGFSRSFGRYPIAKKWQEQRLTKNAQGVDAGPSWDESNHQVIEALLSRLKSEIQSLSR